MAIFSPSSLETLMSPSSRDQITQILRSLAHATNTRHLDRSNPLFKRVLTPGFVAPSAPHFRDKPKKLHFEKYIATQRAVIEEFPDFHIEFRDLDAAVIDEEAGTAQVFAKYEVTGQPKGVVRKYVAVFWFRLCGRERDEWKCSTFEVVEGMDGGAHAL